MQTLKDNHCYNVRSYNTTGKHPDYKPENEYTGSKKDAHKLARRMIKDGASHVNIWLRLEVCR